MIKYYFKKLIGWWRIRYGFCPLCYSSPPSKRCPVCFGSYIYGAQLTGGEKDLWWRRYLIRLRTERYYS